MKFMRNLFIFSLISFFSFQSFAQVTKVSDLVKGNFSQQYPDAQNVKWYNDVIKVNVQFEVGEDKMDAQYTNKGVWKNTLKVISFEELPAEVIDGFEKSKYANRQVTDVRIVFLPGDMEQYRIKVEKSNVQQKYLYFNADGRLLRDANTL